jgi:mRNA interferase MazF
VRGHAFETDLNDPDIKVKGVVLCQQIKMIDFKERGLLFVAKAPGEVLNKALGKSRAILA